MLDGKGVMLICSVHCIPSTSTLTTHGAAAHAARIALVSPASLSCASSGDSALLCRCE